MKHEVKVMFYLKKSEAKKNGECPVMARLSVGKYSTVAFSMKLNAPVSLWVSGRVTGKSSEAQKINRLLDGTRGSAQSIYLDLSAIRDHVSAEDVRNILLGMARGQQTLLSYFHAYNENFEKRVGVNRVETTAKSYRYALNHLRKFLQMEYKLSDIPFTALNRSFVEKYDLYLRVVCKIAPRTIILLTTRLSTIIRHAIAEGIITTNPFAGYEPARPRHEQRYLTHEELERMMRTPLTCPKHYLIRDLFLFSCYTGISYVDMCKLTDRDLEVREDGEMWIKATRQKTGVEYELPLLDLPKEILDRYRGSALNGKLLPMYDDSELNFQLKRIALTCGVNRRLTFHMARHTYATEITLSQGVPIETVSRMLGHSQIKTTQIYAKITKDKIDEDMKTLEQRLAGKFAFAL